MFGFILGTVCLVGLMKTLRRARHGYYGGHWGRGYALGGACGGGACGYGGHGPWGHGGHGGPFGGGFGPRGGRGFEGGEGPWGARGGDPLRWMLRGLFERLDTTPGQEKVILAAVEAMRAKGGEIRDAVHGTGGDVAKAFRGERFDESAMADAFTRQDAALENAQKALFEALAKVHEVLDERQRRELAELMERGLGFWSHRGFGGPYRV